MSVYIKGMKMPENCMLCPFCVEEADPANGEMCMITGKLMPPCTRVRLEDCPLIHINENPTITGEELGELLGHNPWMREESAWTMELKPCPYCGHEARVYCRDGVRIKCPNCGCETPNLSDRPSERWESGKENALEIVIKKWNRRVKDG